MMKRITWFTAGTVTGAIASAWAYRQVREIRGRDAADQLADTVVNVSQRVGSRVRDAVADGVEAMRAAEADMGTRPSLVDDGG
jgi:hypothetical protein